MPKRAGSSSEKNVNAPVDKGGPTMTDQTSMVKAATGGALLAGVPDWLKAELDATPTLRNAGFENITGADLILPRLAIAHGTSKEIMDKSLGIEIGDIFDTMTKTVICKAGSTVPIILLVASKSRIMFEKPQPPSPILCRSLDGLKATSKNGMTKREEPTDNCADCIHQLFSDDKKPACTEFLSFLALFPTVSMACFAISFKSTGLKKGKGILTQSKMTGAPMFAGKYDLSSLQQTNGQNTWFIFDAKPAGWAAEDEYKRAKQQYEGLKGKTWAPTDLESEAGDETAPREPGSDDGDGPVVEGTAEKAADGHGF